MSEKREKYNTANDKWNEITSAIPSPLRSHFLGSTVEIGNGRLIVYLPAQTANIEHISRQIEPKYIAPMVAEFFGDVAIHYQKSLPNMPQPKERIRIIDKRKPRHFRVDNELFDHGHAARLKPSGTIVYLCLCRHADYYTNDCYPSYLTIAKECGMGRSTVIDYCKKLATRGYIEIEHQFKNNGDYTSNIFYILELPNI